MNLVGIAALGVAVVAGAFGAHAKEWTSIKIGTEASYPPFAFVDASGELAGFDIEIGNALCEQMEVKCEWISLDWDGLIPGLIAGKHDAILASMSITDERKQVIGFSKKYYQTPSGIAVSKDSPLTEATPEALEDMIVGAQGSTTHSVFAEETFANSDIKLYGTAEEYKLELESGRIDAAIDDIMILSEWVKSEDGACCKVLQGFKSVPAIHGEGAGIGVRKEDMDLADKFSKAVAELRANGTYKAINDKYFDFDVYGD
ncbi:transporter substrate-binding domain-containing protein [Polycladidibacter hongkongensis]|uniref:transporter substrate-binding domain-containing protein n=1 Tax=Polycladidibacter hongkongensis TaxID=1647556 RepID=UPI000831A1DB|nr:transporter substrate-binding domain-containing protein [Pseudovibrio hongkongensis]